MELCICDLEQCIQMREKGLLVNEIKEVLTQINHALKLILKEKIILRDLSPKNILISLNKIDKYLFKLSNFDIMSNIGNHLSMAPEILDKDKFGKEDLSKSDLWSIGIIIYYLYFKQYPYNGKDGNELCKDIYSNKQLNEINNEKLNDLMNKLLKINVKERISWNEYFNHFFFTNGEKDLNYLTLFKTSKKKLCHHKDIVYCLTLLNDGRLVSGSDDNSIIIYNKVTFQFDLEIKEHKLWINYLTILKNGLLVSCSADKTIKLFDIKEKEYKLINSLDFHLDSVNQIIELTNNSLVSCSDDKSIIFYIKENEKYNKDYSITTSDWVKNIIQTKQNENAY
jgi:serine/threonine protein kinase